MADLDERVTRLEDYLEKLIAYARTTKLGRALLDKLDIE